MARKPRFNLPGIPQHVIQRTTNRDPYNSRQEVTVNSNYTDGKSLVLISKLWGFKWTKGVGDKQ